MLQTWSGSWLQTYSHWSALTSSQQTTRCSFQRQIIIDVAVDVAVYDALPEMLLVPVLVPLRVADTRTLDVADVVWLKVADADAVDGKVLVTEET
jgi:hypothetical protein